MYPSIRQSKPWPGAGIDWTHPLAQGLQFAIPFNEGSGSPYEIVNRINPSSIPHLGWGSGIDGWVGTFNGSNATAIYPTPAFATSPGVTVLVRCAPASLSVNQELAMLYSGSTHEWRLYLSSTGVLTWAGTVNPRNTWTLSGISANTWHTFVAVDSAAALNQAALYADGITVSGTGNSGNSGTVGNAAGSLYVGSYDNSSNYFAGSISLVLVWNRMLTPQQIDQVSVNPWQIFQPAWPRGLIIKASTSFLVTENALPTHHAGGTVTVHAVGTNTSWTSGTTFSLSGVSGWSIASQTFVNSTHVTLVLSCPASGGATGTLTLSDGQGHTAGANVGAPSLSCSPTTISVYDNMTVTFTGANTLWSEDNPTFTISGSAGATISALTVSSNTSATATVYAGSTYGATLTVTDPSTGATTTLSTASNTVTTTAYVTKSGELVAFNFGNSSNAPVAVTAINNLPTFLKNGSSITCLGPFWDLTTKTDPFVFYKLPSAVLSSDVITFAASAGWVTTTAGPSTVYHNGSTANYTGTFESPLYGCVPFTYLPTSTNGLQVGCNAGLSGIFNTNAPGSISQNWVHRGGWLNPGTTIGSSTPDGRPITISSASGTVKLSVADAQTGNGVDNLFYPDLVGTWSFVADETNPSHPMKVAIQWNSSAVNVISGPTTPSAPTTAGTSGTINGNPALIGQTWQWTFAFKNSPTALDLGLDIVIQTYNAAAGNYTLTNEWLFAPNGAGGGAPPLVRSNAAQTDPNFLSWISVGKKGSAAFRSGLGGYNGAQANMVNAADFYAPTDMLWTSGKVTNTATITSIQAYTLGSFPNLYFANNYTGTTVNSGGSGALAYYYAPSSIIFTDFTNLAAGGQYFVGICSCSSPHGLYSGQLVTLTGTMPTISVTQGQSAPINYTFGTASDTTLNAQSQPVLNYPIWVTSATTFLFWGTLTGSSFTKGTLVANTVATTYNVPGGSPFYASVSLPDSGVPPIEVMAQVSGNTPSGAGLASIPLIATDAMAAHAANLYLQYLSPGQLCYVEVGNEPWNNMFWQGPFFNGVLCNMAGGSFAGLGDGTSAILRAMQVANIFRTVLGAAGQAGSVRSFVNVQAFNPAATQSIVSTLNTYNAANPSAPFQLDAIAVAPYIGVTGSDQQVNPTAQATVALAGSGGSLAAGTYYAAYTYIDALTGYESSVGSSESAQFTASGTNIPTITFHDTLPATVASRNVYLTLANGAAGSEVLYATGVTTSTYACSAANTGSAAAPKNSRAPSYTWAAASIAASNSESIANTSVNPGNPYTSNPWTYNSWSDYLRHYCKYNTTYSGPNGLLAQHLNYLSAYTPVNSQNAPRLVTYEGMLQTLVSQNVQNGSPSGGSPGGLPGQLTHDVFYHPSMYYVHLAYLQMLQQNGVSLTCLEALASTRQFIAHVADVWSHVVWAGQQPGKGDNSDGKGTNLLWLNTGTAQDLNNVSPRLQAWQDWVTAGNAAPGGLLAPFSRSPMIRSAATHGRHGLVMTRAKLPANLPKASANSARKRWFPGMSPIRKTF